MKKTGCRHRKIYAYWLRLRLQHALAELEWSEARAACMPQQRDAVIDLAARLHALRTGNAAPPSARAIAHGIEMSCKRRVLS